MGGSKKQTVGYRYFMGLHFGLCQGPVDALLEIRGGDRTAWKGSVTTSQGINIRAPELWGGEKKEGGIVGHLDVMMGEPSQAPNPYLASQIAGPMPAFRGFLSLVFRKGMVGAMNPYPKPWSFNVRRILKGWHGGTAWNPGKAAVMIAGAVAGRYSQAFNDSLQNYTLERGSISSFTATGAGLLIGPSSASEFSAVSRQVMGEGLVRRVSFDFSIIETGDSDTASFNLSEGGEVFLSFNPRRGLDSAKRAALGFNSGITEQAYFGDSSLPAGVRFRFIAEAGTDGVLRASINNLSTGAVFAELSLPGASRGFDKFQFWARGPGVVRCEKAEWELSRARISMNPAHIIYQALTDPDWGMGYPESALDIGSFTSAADTFYAEGIGLCGQWTRQDTIESFVQEVLSHAGAALGQDPRTGLFRLIPTRGGYEVATLPEFRRGLNVSAVDSFERAALGETVNEVTVQYVDADTGNDGAVTVQHLANVQAQGGVVSQSVRYPMAPTASIAQRLAQRDLTAKASPLCKVKLTTDRSAFGLLPGDVVRWTDAKLGITDMPMRVLQVDYGSLTAGAIKLDLAEDVFGMPATTYLGQQEGGWVEPTTEPQPPAAAQVFEIPYLAIHRAEGGSVANALSPDAGYLGMLAAKAPGVSYGYTLMASVAGGEFEQVGGGEWAASAILAADIGPADTVLTLGGVTDAGEFSAGALVMIGGGDDAELVRIDSAAPGAASITVGRGVGDTVAGPAGWPIGTRVWVVDDNVGEGVTEYVEGEAVEARASTNAPGGTLPLGASPGGVVTMAARAARPYPPAGLTVGGVAWPVQVIGDIELAWAHRDRLLQADQLVDQAAGSIGPEAGTTYTVRTYLDDVLDDEQTGINGTDAIVQPSGNGVARVEVVSVRDGLESWQAQVREFQYRTTAYDEYTDQGGIAYADQDGQTYEG